MLSLIKMNSGWSDLCSGGSSPLFPTHQIKVTLELVFFLLITFNWLPLLMSLFLLHFQQCKHDGFKMLFCHFISFCFSHNTVLSAWFAGYELSFPELCFCWAVYVQCCEKLHIFQLLTLALCSLNSETHINTTLQWSLKPTLDAFRFYISLWVCCPLWDIVI